MTKSPLSLNDPQRSLVKTIEQLSYRRRTWEVFRDFVEMAALAISNSCDLRQYEAREARYMQIVKTYDKAEAMQMSFALACVVECLEAGITDCLGTVFMSMELGSHWHGQYFSPWPICSMMARLVAGDSLSAFKESSREFVTVHEPAAGSGAMVLAFADAMRMEGINYQHKMHATLVDIDITAVHMAYIQCSLCHIPAIVTHGNALSLETWSHWHTPAHVMGFWDHKLARRARQNGESMPAPASIDNNANEVKAAASVPLHSVDVTLPSQLLLL